MVGFMRPADTILYHQVSLSFPILFILILRIPEIHLFYNLQDFYWHFLEILWLFIFLFLYSFLYSPFIPFFPSQMLLLFLILLHQPLIPFFLITSGWWRSQLQTEARNLRVANKGFIISDSWTCSLPFFPFPPAMALHIIREHTRARQIQARKCRNQTSARSFIIFWPTSSHCVSN